uniref:Uncharacterized protein n=1 Tax=Hordeum vulgare subsp. vulgare TaxID=112509 RepID=A0A8I6XBT9_HORVV
MTASSASYPAGALSRCPATSAPPGWPSLSSSSLPCFTFPHVFSSLTHPPLSLLLSLLQETTMAPSTSPAPQAPNSPRAGDPAGTMGPRMTCSPRIHLLSRGHGAAMAVPASTPSAQYHPQLDPARSRSVPITLAMVALCRWCVHLWRRTPAICLVYVVFLG